LYDGAEVIVSASLQSGKTKLELEPSVFSFAEKIDPGGRAKTLKVDVPIIEAKLIAAGLPTSGNQTLTFRYRTALPDAAGFAPVSKDTAVFVFSNESAYEWREGATPAAQIIVHEMGHRLGLATFEPGLLSRKRSNGLDANPKLYEGRGHRGPHCHHGVPLLDSYQDETGSKVEGDCAMFGRVMSCYSRTGTTVTVKDTVKFCPQCYLDLVRMDKIHVSAGG
jgi:hypothetical protein